MNLIDFHVTKVLGQPVECHSEGYTWWEVQVEYSDDGGDGLHKTVWCQTQISAEAIKPGYVGQH